MRVTEVYRIRLAGAKLLDVQEYVREQEQTDGSAWKLADGDKPLSEAQICVYIRRADEALMSLNILFLMAIAALPFPSAVMGRYGDQRAAVVLYASSMIVAGSLLVRSCCSPASGGS